MSFAPAASVQSIKVSFYLTEAGRVGLVLFTEKVTMCSWYFPLQHLSTLTWCVSELPCSVVSLHTLIFNPDKTNAVVNGVKDVVIRIAAVPT